MEFVKEHYPISTVVDKGHGPRAFYYELHVLLGFSGLWILRYQNLRSLEVSCHKSTLYYDQFWWCAILNIRWMVWNLSIVFFLWQGVYVTYVYEGSPAQLAGLQVHDKLLQVVLWSRFFEFWLMTIKYWEFRLNLIQWNSLRFAEVWAVILVIPSVKVDAWWSICSSRCYS